MIELADLEEEDIVLEPSAGLGFLAEAAREKVAAVHCVEIQPELADILEMKGFDVVRGDFLETNITKPVNKILMNPPFENRQDLQHIQRAFEVLPEKGRLVAIATVSITRYGVDWLKRVWARIEPNPDDAFRSAFRPASVRTVTIVITK